MDRNVYVIDGDAAIRDGLQTLGELLGVLVHCYASAEEFLSREISPHRLPVAQACIICAEELSGISGLSLFEQLRAHDHQLPFALMTSSRSLLLKKQACRAGVDQIVEKPLADQTLSIFIEAKTDTLRTG